MTLAAELALLHEICNRTFNLVLTCSMMSALTTVFFFAQMAGLITSAGRCTHHSTRNAIAANISTGGAAKGVSVPHMDTMTNKTARWANLPLLVRHWAWKTSCGPVIRNLKVRHEKKLLLFSVSFA